jgi:Undecaprenyl-phosphate glucose phosphotransferase
VYLNIIYIFSAKLSGTFDMYRNTSFATILSMLAKLFFFQILLSFSYIVVFKDFNQTFKISREVLLVTYGTSILLTTIWRFSLIKIVRYYRSKGYNNRKAIIIGAGPTAQEFRNMLYNKVEYGLNFLGFFEDEKDKYPKVADQIVGKVSESMQFAIDNHVDEIFCALPYDREEQIKELYQFADKQLIRFKIVPDLSVFLAHQMQKVEIDYYGSMPVLILRKEPLEYVMNRFLKRAFDFTFSLLVTILILSWLVPLIALLIKLTSKGPVFFIQQRTGIKNKPFKVIKFRTMYVNDEADELQATRDDPRITPLGRILRKTNLDELPQFFNVLLGHMSVIGPRPHMLKHTEEYSKIIDKFMVRHFIKPGITGWAQVNGYRGETKDPKEMEMRVQADIWYMENWSFFLDIRIIFLTIFKMIVGDGKAF